MRLHLVVEHPDRTGDERVDLRELLRLERPELADVPERRHHQVPRVVRERVQDHERELAAREDLRPLVVALGRQVAEDAALVVGRPLAASMYSIRHGDQMRSTAVRTPTGSSRRVPASSTSAATNASNATPLVSVPSRSRTVSSPTRSPCRRSRARRAPSRPAPSGPSCRRSRRSRRPSAADRPRGSRAAEPARARRAGRPPDEPDLLRREPERERAGVVLDQHRGEPLERAEDRPVDHHRPVPLVVLAHVLHVEPLGQAEVALHGRELPQPADRVAEVEVDLRAVERPSPSATCGTRARCARGRRSAPVARSAISGSRSVARQRRELDHGVGEPERRVDLLVNSNTRRISSTSWSGVQTMWASSIVPPRIRSRPVEVPTRSCR